jgi:aspartyl-tRNA(Asn)/glutamyl-tRNA(Gln) amidotransferase subunit B
VEVKNLNSIRNVKRAIEYEATRLIDILKNGGTIIQQTRSFDALNGTTFALRTKEEANDYRYFADPDLVPFNVSAETITNIRQSIPALPEERVKRYVSDYHLPEYDARALTSEKELSDYFEEVIRFSTNYKAVSNWLLGPVKSYLNENSLTIGHFTMNPSVIADLISLTDEGKLNFSTASTAIFPVLIKEPHKTARGVAAEKNLAQDADEATVTAWVDEVLNKMPDKVSEYKKGKKGLIGLFVGEVKKASKGKADPKLTNELLLKKLQS